MAIATDEKRLLPAAIAAAWKQRKLRYMPRLAWFALLAPEWRWHWVELARKTARCMRY